MDLDALCRQARDHHRQLLDDAARARLRSRPPTAHQPGISVRRMLATALRRWADRVEPSMAAASIGPLRALAHREIDVDQAMLLLDQDSMPLRVATNR